MNAFAKSDTARAKSTYVRSMAAKTADHADQRSDAQHAAAVSLATRAVLGEVAAERRAQNAKWGEQNLPDGTAARGDRRRANRKRRETNRAHANGVLSWRDVLEEEMFEALAESDKTELRAELVQVAAVAASWIEALDRRNAYLVS
jgi:hypothetical protein